MRSHFLPRGVAAACAVAGATTVLNGHCAAGTFIAADYATNSTYGSGWSAGQNGGYGFGAWSFDGTVYGTNIMGTNIDISAPGALQEMSSSSAIGTAWTLFNLTSTNGISDVGRAIAEPGGLQPGQTFETIIQNPTNYNFYRGFDILFYNGTTNLPGGDNTSAIRMLVFNYFTSIWKINDNSGTTLTALSSASTGAAGMKFDFTLLSTNTYSLTLTPLSNPSAAYSQTGQLANSLPINWVIYRLWDGQSSGPNDTADNFEISSMTIAGLTLNIQLAGANAILSWTTNVPGFYLASSTNLGPSAVWSTNLPSPVVVNGQNVVTNPIANSQQFFRLQQ